jgi:peptide/nickel transport system ATP-binding protein
MTADVPVLELHNLTVSFARGFRKPPFVAVDDVSFRIAAGQTVGLVGESGSGKSTIGNAILGLVTPVAGSIEHDGRDITSASKEQRRRLGRDIQVVFQDPYGSFNPSRTVGQALAEPLRAHGEHGKDAARAAVGDMLSRVGLRPSDAERHPASFSGGQRQRIAVARALMTRPRVVVCDEAVSALDLSTQAQVLNLLRDLQDELGLALLFISHDLAVVRYMAHEVVVLQRGRVVEAGAADVLYERPREEYTRQLVAASPLPDPTTGRL